MNNNFKSDGYLLYLNQSEGMKRQLFDGSEGTWIFSAGYSLAQIQFFFDEFSLQIPRYMKEAKDFQLKSRFGCTLHLT